MCAVAVCVVYSGFWLVVTIPFGAVVGWSPVPVFIVVCALVCLGFSTLAWRMPLTGGILLSLLGIVVSLSVELLGIDAYPSGLVLAAPLFVSGAVFAVVRYEGEPWSAYVWPWIDVSSWWWGPSDK
jgi:hypothetical protein